MFGLLKRDEEIIIEALSKVSNIDFGIIFGSRAIGNYKNGSDVDIALKGNLNVELLIQLSNQLNEELPLPYYFDVIDYSTISNDALRAHIDKFGKIIYSK